MSCSVVLVNPDMFDYSDQFPIQTMRRISPQVPLGLCYLAAVLEENNIDVSIIDNYVCSFSSRLLADKIVQKEPDIVGFSITTQNSFQGFETASLIKKRCPHIKIVFGGIHPSVLPTKVMKKKDVDYVVVSEGEYVLLELVKAEMQNGKGEIPKIEGLFYRKDSGEIGYGGNREPITDLNKLPFPARHLLELSWYQESSAIFGIKNPMSLNSSRGCPFRCAFCSSSAYWNRKFRARSASSIVDEIELLIHRFGADAIRFREDNFTTSKKRVVEICDELIKRGIDILWECESRVDTVDQDLLRIMRDGGCRSIWFGVESGNQRTLDLLNKGVRIDQIRDVFTWCHDLGLKTGATFMIGVPGESREEVLQTFQFAKEINPAWASFQAYLGLPTSPLYDYVCKNNMCFHRVGDICIVQTDQLSFYEIVELEKFLNEEYFRHKLVTMSRNTFIRFMIKRCPHILLKKMVTFYWSFALFIRRKLKSMVSSEKEESKM